MSEGEADGPSGSPLEDELKRALQRLKFLHDEEQKLMAMFEEAIGPLRARAAEEARLVRALRRQVLLAKPVSRGAQRLLREIRLEGGLRLSSLSGRRVLRDLRELYTRDLAEVEERARGVKYVVTTRKRKNEK